MYVRDTMTVEFWDLTGLGKVSCKYHNLKNKEKGKVKGKGIKLNSAKLKVIFSLDSSQSPSYGFTTITPVIIGNGPTLTN